MKKLYLIIFINLLVIFPTKIFASNDRIALVIGNSNYQHLSKLDNTINDAKAIQKSLGEIGFKTFIATDISSNEIRKSIRKFALESKNSEIALVFYAGHGAQVFGENYLLPTDMEVPKIESDIQLSGVSIDDLLNSLGSKTKIVFLDACRDNPALIKSLSKGRGSYQNGLAPPKSSNESGSGVFIAYATDSGNIALDGTNSHNSPFTKALLKNIKKPISIDDMFSMVTNDVRIMTKNKQRPYKYASLNGVVCLTNKCAAYAYSDIQEDSLDIASQLKNKEKKIAMLDDNKKNKDTFVNEINSFVLSLSKDDFEEADDWILVNHSTGPGAKTTLSIKPSSIIKDGDISKILVKWERADSSFFSKGNSYSIGGWSFDCKNKKGGAYSSDEFDKSGKMTESFQFHDPNDKSKMDADYNSQESRLTLGFSMFSLACNPEMVIPDLNKKLLNKNLWTFGYQTTDNARTHYLKDSIKKNGDTVDLYWGFFYPSAVKLGDTIVGSSFKDFNTPKITKYIGKSKFYCTEKKALTIKELAYGENDRYIFLSGLDSAQYSKYDVSPGSGFESLFNEVCK